MTNLPPDRVASLAALNAAHETAYSLVITRAEAEELATGRVPENVVAMAKLALEPLSVMLARKMAAAHK